MVELKKGGVTAVTTDESGREVEVDLKQYNAICGELDRAKAAIRVKESLVVSDYRKAACDWCGNETDVRVTHYGTSHYNRLVCDSCLNDLVKERMQITADIEKGGYL